MMMAGIREVTLRVTRVGLWLIVGRGISNGMKEYWGGCICVWLVCDGRWR